MVKVKLRKKPITAGRQTLYLDYYPPIPHPETGTPTRREFLKLYIYDRAKTLTDKQHNAETLALAENIKAKRQLSIQQQEYGFLSQEKQQADFIQYFKSLVYKRDGSNAGNWLSALQYLKNFTGGSLRFKELNEPFCREFKEYLLQVNSTRSGKMKLSQNTAVSYFSKFRFALKQAFKEGYLKTDLNSQIEGIKPDETERQYLTLEELQKLVNADCSVPLLKKAALFSALTGLRHSDIKKLVWSEVQHSNNEGYYIRFRQKKTKGVETLPIPNQAFSLLGERGKPDEQVFNGLKYSAWHNQHLGKWLLKAGIDKNITFHCFRHTYATLQISLGTDLYTVSKMLGHREIKTTQVYAKIIDKQKREAANKIKLQF